MKHKQKIFLSVVAVFFLLPAILFFSWLNASGEGADSSVEANLFSLADFDKGAMLSASCDAGLSYCQWSETGCDEDGCGVCESTVPMGGVLKLFHDTQCRQYVGGLYIHPGDDGALDGDHYKDCPTCAAVFFCTGSDPDNATLCPDDSIGLSIDTPKTIVSFCTITDKCEYSCDSGYVLSGGYCVLSPSPPLPPATPPCDPNQICKGKTCPNGTPGTKDCGWREVAP